MLAEFPLHRLDSQVFLCDFGLSLRADKTAVEDKLQGVRESIAPERYHGSDPSPASDMWSFMIVFVCLCLGQHAFTNTLLRDFHAQLGPLPATWAKPKYDETLYASPGEVDLADPPASKSRLGFMTIGRKMSRLVCAPIRDLRQVAIGVQELRKR